MAENDRMNRQDASGRSKATQWSIGSIFFLVVISVVAKFLGHEFGSSLGKADVETSSRAFTSSAQRPESLRDPNGDFSHLFGTTWLMTMEECRSKLPDAVNTKENQLMVKRQFYGHDVVVTFTFSETDALIIYVITFVGPSSKGGFQDVQQKLIEDYGVMSVPKPFNDFTLFSERKVDRFVMDHGLHTVDGASLNQIIIYRSK